MVDRDKVKKLLQHLCVYTEHLRGIVDQDRRAYLQDPKSTGSARYYLQVSIETCINIAHHIIATEKLRAPTDYRDSFRVLDEVGIVPHTLARKMQELAGLRNILVHLYLEVDDELIYEGIRTELGDFAAFAEHILAFMDSADDPDEPGVD
jgi:uncharacterized protein YutE (UPF0331/DUF86 family)